ncbi:DUF3060 domain-containing protein [Archangium sp.]|uniref:DUF3060 domain-containing protein n=1 Tax=Archangium sp. TaxID=1872627 RepID=UPI00389AA0AB
MSKFVRGTVLSGVLASLLLVPAVGVAQGRTAVKVNKNGHTEVQVKAGNTTVKTDDADADSLGGADVEDEDEGAKGDEKPADDKLEVSGMGGNATHRCTPKTEVEVNGSDNTVTLTGDCKSINVSGANNKVKAEGVATIDVTGSGNEVTWKRAVGGKKPKVNRSGVDNKVTQAR